MCDRCNTVASHLHRHDAVTHMLLVAPMKLRPRDDPIFFARVSAVMVMFTSIISTESLSSETFCMCVPLPCPKVSNRCGGQEARLQIIHINKRCCTNMEHMGS